MKFQIPKAFTLLGRRWTVSRVPKIRFCGGLAHGITRHLNASIELAKSPPPPDGELDVFCHELIHAAIPDGTIDDPELEEEIANILAAALPDLVRALTGLDVTK